MPRSLEADIGNGCAGDEYNLGLFLELAMGLSAWKRLGPDRWALRNNPSSGNLHPAETYLLLWNAASTQLIPDLYHYAPYEHGLERRALLPAAWAAALRDACPGRFGAIAFSSIIWREAWYEQDNQKRFPRYAELEGVTALLAQRDTAYKRQWNARNPTLA